MVEVPFRYWPWIPARKKFIAITLPPFGVLVRASTWEAADDEKRRRMVLHEAKHWQQYQERGPWKYYSDYFRLWVQHGYADHPMEIEARRAEG